MDTASVVSSHTQISNVCAGLFSTYIFCHSLDNNKLKAALLFQTVAGWDQSSWICRTSGQYQSN